MIAVAVLTLYDLPGFVSKHYICLLRNKKPSSFPFLQRLVLVVYVTICRPATL